MAQIFGFLREDKATHGEKLVLKHLKNNLPNDFAVYVECPIHDRRQLRYPDFIVSTNYGVVVLEVKDWVTVQKADRFGAEIFTRDQRTRREGNPIIQARELALLLINEFRRIQGQMGKSGEIKDVPWGYAAVLPNLPTSVITQLRKAWGEEFVLNLDDLGPDRALARLKDTLPAEHIRALHKAEMDLIRATINPTVLIEAENRPVVILDVEQEKIVAESVKEAPQPQPAKPKPVQTDLFEPAPSSAAQASPKKAAEEQLPEYAEALSKNAGIRLVRGVAGSGKTLVLTQRARFLAAQYPDWEILVLTFNNALSRHLSDTLAGTGRVKVMTFHGLCRSLIEGAGLEWASPISPREWLKEQKGERPVLEELGADFLEEEIAWIKESGIQGQKAYLEIERKGRGGGQRLGQEQRKQIYQLLVDYQKHLSQEKAIDWADIPYIMLNGMRLGKIESPNYGAILIDEAQDFAPVWLRVIRKLLDPQQGVLFLADDPSQSIYRLYSWREKGIEVVGRTRHLKLPYRNTEEIYRAAFALIEDEPILQKALEHEGQVLPELGGALMRHGERPLLRRCESFEQETTLIREQVRGFIQGGVDGKQIAVLHRNRAGVTKLEAALRGLEVEISTFHASKGLEYEKVFISQMQTTFKGFWEDPEALAEELRLVYMAMTRARSELKMYYQGNLPNPMRRVLDYVDCIQ